jgi:hypothetical protein
MALLHSDVLDSEMTPLRILYKAFGTFCQNQSPDKLSALLASLQYQ